MKNQPCLIESPTPLISNRDYVSLCQRWIQFAYFTASWDEQRMGLLVFVEPDRLCPKCRKVLAAKLLQAERGQQYLYAMVPGSEVKQQFMED